MSRTKNDHKNNKWPRERKMTTRMKTDHGNEKWTRKQKMTTETKNDNKNEKMTTNAKKLRWKRKMTTRTTRIGTTLPTCKWTKQNCNKQNESRTKMPSTKTTWCGSCLHVKHHCAHKNQENQTWPPPPPPEIRHEISHHWHGKSTRKTKNDTKQSNWTPVLPNSEKLKIC